MKALYEVIVKSINAHGNGVAIHTEIIDFDSINNFNSFIENIESYECVDGIQIWRTITIIN